MNGWLEIPVFIHGIILEDSPQSHFNLYDQLLDLVNEELTESGKQRFTQPQVGVEWGWGKSSGKDEVLAETQATLAKLVMPSIRGQRDVTINPFRMISYTLREAFLRGFSDMFYYISADGEKAVRENVFIKIAEEIDKQFVEEDTKVSLTIFAHSAGSVIAHDLLYNLHRGPAKNAAYSEKVGSIHDRYADGRLRIRKLFTFGSPITPLIVRSMSLMHEIRAGKKLDTTLLGFKSSDGINNPRWVNFWDKDDIIAFPLGFLYSPDENGQLVVQDEYINVSDRLGEAHTAYWTSTKMAKKIASYF